jgi:hypothetical protein
VTPTTWRRLGSPARSRNAAHERTDCTPSPVADRMGLHRQRPWQVEAAHDANSSILAKCAGSVIVIVLHKLSAN